MGKFMGLIKTTPASKPNANQAVIGGSSVRASTKDRVACDARSNVMPTGISVGPREQVTSLSSLSGRGLEAPRASWVAVCMAMMKLIMRRNALTVKYGCKTSVLTRRSKKWKRNAAKRQQKPKKLSNQTTTMIAPRALAALASRIIGRMPVG